MAALPWRPSLKWQTQLFLALQHSTLLTVSRELYVPLRNKQLLRCFTQCLPFHFILLFSQSHWLHLLFSTRAQKRFSWLKNLMVCSHLVHLIKKNLHSVWDLWWPQKMVTWLPLSAHDCFLFQHSTPLFNTVRAFSIVSLEMVCTSAEPAIEVISGQTYCSVHVSLGEKRCVLFKLELFTFTASVYGKGLKGPSS